MECLVDKILPRNSNGGRCIAGKTGRRINGKAGVKRQMLFNDDESPSTIKQRKLENYRIDNINRCKTSLDAGCESFLLLLQSQDNLLQLPRQFLLLLG